MKLRDIELAPAQRPYEVSPFLLRPDGARARVWHNTATEQWVYSECENPDDTRYQGRGAWAHHRGLTPLEVQALLAGHRLDPHQGVTITPEVTE